MNILQLYEDFSVDYRTEGHKHCRPGWVNTECPFCEGHEGYHLGYHLEMNYFVCWRCGFHPVVPTIAKLINENIGITSKIIQRYGLFVSVPKTETNTELHKTHQLPSHVTPLQLQHQKYLEKRKFDPIALERNWGLLGTGPTSLLDGINYRHRIIIPFFWDGEQVSFDSRDITNHHQAKYMACPKNRELIPHKEILYGKQERWGSTGICVEGPADVWRFGFDAFATSGIKYTTKQVRLIAKMFKKVWICFDAEEPQALQQMMNLRAELRFRGVIADLALLEEGDPGSMDQEKANQFVKQLI